LLSYIFNEQAKSDFEEGPNIVLSEGVFG